jgi:hypothetical protein
MRISLWKLNGYGWNDGLDFHELDVFHGSQSG